MANKTTARICVTPLLSAKTATGSGGLKPGVADVKTFEAYGTTTAGAGAATIQIRGTNNGGTTYEVLGTISLTLGTSATGDAFTSDDRFLEIDANVTAISGTGANVTCIMSH